MNDRERQLVLRYLLLEREQKRRAEPTKLSLYNAGGKVHKKQLEFHRCLKRSRWVFGGNRSGKTECGAVEAVWAARGIHPYRPNRPNCEGWVVSLSYEVQRDVAQAKILSYLRPEWIADVVMLSGRKGAATSSAGSRALPSKAATRGGKSFRERRSTLSGSTRSRPMTSMKNAACA